MDPDEVHERTTRTSYRRVVSHHTQRVTVTVAGSTSIRLSETGGAQVQEFEDTAELEDIDELSIRIQEQLRSYVFTKLPIHLIHLQSAQLCDRQTVLERILPSFRALTAQDIPEDVQTSLLNPEPSIDDIPIIHKFFRNRVRYAVLSDDWGNPEPPYADIPGPSHRETKPDRFNVARFCEVARSHDAEFAWCDSCCINRYVDGERNRSIRAMYGWYANSSICIAHLADAMSVEELGKDTWFKRGWTLLQLLAPERLKFYNKAWDPLTDNYNDKYSQEILASIERATSISPVELLRFDPRSPDSYQVSKRMRWAANRTTTLAEDRAYSLMGVFGVDLDLSYGEGGPRAFSRLFREIALFSNSPEVVNWVGRPEAGLSLRSFAYPPSPDAFIDSNDVVGLVREELISLVANGLSIKLLVLPATLLRWETDVIAVFRCFEVQLQVDCISGFKPNDPGDEGRVDYALGGWNFSTSDGRVQRVGDVIEAILLYRVVNPGGSKDVWSRIPTRSFIRFTVANPPRGKRWADYVQTVSL